MRSAARLKMGYYPLPESEGVKLRSLLSFNGRASVIDPCVGPGTALNLVTHDAPVRRYGIELDAERARIASSKGIETIQGNTFDAIAKPESFSLLYLNPPYDSEIGTIVRGSDAELSRPSVRPVGRPAAAIGRMEAGGPAVDAARRRCDWSPHHASAWRPCGASVYCGAAERRFRRRREPTHRPLAVRQACDNLC